MIKNFSPHVAFRVDSGLLVLKIHLQCPNLENQTTICQTQGAPWTSADEVGLHW